MKKLISLLIVLVLCLGMVATASAADNEFVPSITYKPTPEIVPVVGEDGEEYIGVIRDGEGNVLDYVDHGCILITPVAHIWDEDVVVPADVERLLRFVYEGLTEGDMEIPYEKHEADLDPENMVIHDLFDARWTCEEHRAMIEQPGVTLEITFELKVDADILLFVTTYDEEADEWEPIVRNVNNGDGTVTCEFEHLCAIEFSSEIEHVAQTPTEPVEQKEACSLLWLWILLLVLAVVAVIVVLVVHKKRSKKSTTV